MTHYPVPRSCRLCGVTATGRTVKVGDMQLHRPTFLASSKLQAPRAPSAHGSSMSCPVHHHLDMHAVWTSGPFNLPRIPSSRSGSNHLSRPILLQVYFSINQSYRRPFFLCRGGYSHYPVARRFVLVSCPKTPPSALHFQGRCRHVLWHRVRAPLYPSSRLCLS